MEPSNSGGRCPSCGAALPEEKGATCPVCHAPLKPPFAVDEEPAIPKDPFAPPAPPAATTVEKPAAPAAGAPFLLDDDEDAGSHNPFLLGSEGEESGPVAPAAPHLAAGPEPPPAELPGAPFAPPDAPFAPPVQTPVPPAPSATPGAAHAPFVLGEDLPPDSSVGTGPATTTGEGSPDEDRAILLGNEKPEIPPAAPGSSTIPFDTGFEDDRKEQARQLLGNAAGGSAPDTATPGSPAIPFDTGFEDDRKEQSRLFLGDDAGSESITDAAAPDAGTASAEAPAPFNLEEPGDAESAPWLRAGPAAHDSSSEIETPFPPPVGSGVIEPPAASLADAVNQSAIDHAPLNDATVDQSPLNSEAGGPAPLVDEATEHLPLSDTPIDHFATDQAPIGTQPAGAAPLSHPSPIAGLPWDAAGAPERPIPGATQPETSVPIGRPSLEEIAATAGSLAGTSSSIDESPVAAGAANFDESPVIGRSANFGEGPSIGAPADADLASPSMPDTAAQDINTPPGSAPPMDTAPPGVSPPISAADPSDLFDLGTDEPVAKTGSEAGPGAVSSTSPLQPWEIAPAASAQPLATEPPAAAPPVTESPAAPVPPWESPGSAGAASNGPAATARPEPTPAPGFSRGPTRTSPVVWIILLLIVVALAVFFYHRSHPGSILGGGAANPSAGAATGVQVYWRFDTRGFVAQTRGTRRLPALPGRVPEVMRVDIENHTGTPLKLKPGWFIVKAVGKRFAPRPQGAPGLMPAGTVPASRNMQGWLLYELPRAALKPGAMTLVYKGPNQVTVTHSKNAPDAF